MAIIAKCGAKFDFKKTFLGQLYKNRQIKKDRVLIDKADSVATNISPKCSHETAADANFPKMRLKNAGSI